MLGKSFDMKKLNGIIFIKPVLEKEKRMLMRPFKHREDRIRTCDTLVPNQVLYQAELLPDYSI